MCIHLMNQRKETNMKRLLILIALLSLIISSGCIQTKTQKGGLYGTAGGAAAGAAIGQAAGRDTESTLIGAAIGAAVGGLAGAGIGNMMDSQEQEMRAALARSEAAAVRREGNLLAISLKGDVTFDTNSATVRPGLYSEINRIVEVLRQYPDTLIRVEGHTDNRGAEGYNYTLSQRRADAVKNIIIQGGVSSGRVETMAFGESSPIAANDTGYGRARNRRVEIKIAPSQY